MADKLNINGKVAQFPNNTKTGTALDFLTKIRANPKHIWYVIIEEQSNHLKMIKYNNSLDLNLQEYITELKQYYIENADWGEDIKDMVVVGEDNFAVVLNIPDVIVEDNTTLISKMTKDLINLLQDD